MTEIDIIKFSGFIGQDEEWLRHVIEFGYGRCGCCMNYEDAVHCEIYKALQGKKRAEEDLTRAIGHYEKAVAINKGMEVGR